MTDNDLRAIIEATREFYLLKGQDGMTCAMMVDLRQAACTDEAMEAVRARLALAAQPAAEPVAWMWRTSAAFPKDVAFTTDRDLADSARENGMQVMPLYAAQPARAGGDAGWHAPGLGEVHNADHTAMIYCEDGDGVVDDELAQRVVAALAAAPQPVRVETAHDEWRIDTSAGRQILVYKNCSVIEGEDAAYVLGLIEEDEQRTVVGVAAAPQPAVAEPAATPGMTRHGLPLRVDVTKPCPHCHCDAHYICGHVDSTARVEQPAASTVPATEATDAEVKKWTAAAEHHEQELERLGAFSGDKDDMAVAIHATVARELRAAIARARQAPAAPAAVEREALKDWTIRRTDTGDWVLKHPYWGAGLFNTDDQSARVSVAAAFLSDYAKASGIGSSKEGGDER